MNSKFVLKKVIKNCLISKLENWDFTVRMKHLGGESDCGWFIGIFLSELDSQLERTYKKEMLLVEAVFKGASSPFPEPSSLF